MTELRAEHNVTQQQCADALGIMQHSYSALEKGRTRVRRRDLVTLAVLYGLTLAEAFPEFAESEVAA
jgi:transcriptional regulator with XRE-family HTH domain